MKALKNNRRFEEIKTWEEESGLINLLSTVNREVDKFNKSFEFGIENLAIPPLDIDGDTEIPLKAGFVLERKNPLLPELRYCLYSMLAGLKLCGYIGMYKNGSITTLKQLKPITDFPNGKAMLHDWLRQLVRASCEKLML